LTTLKAAAVVRQRLMHRLAARMMKPLSWTVERDAVVGPKQ
jgi:hypothetical protein